MDSSLPLLRLPCHHPSRPPALPPAHGLPSHGLAGGGSGGVRQSPRLPDGEGPPLQGAPSGGKAASSPGPGRSLSGVGAGSCAWPQELLASASPSLCSASLVPAHCAHCLRCSETLRSRPVWFSAWPCAAQPSGPPCVCRKECNSGGPLPTLQGHPLTPQHRVRDHTGTELVSPAISPRLPLQPKLGSFSFFLSLP